MRASAGKDRYGDFTMFGDFRSAMPDEKTARVCAAAQDLIDFCQEVCPSDSFVPWDADIGVMVKKCQKKDRDNLLELLDEAASYCPVFMQDKIRAASKPWNGLPVKATNTNL